MIELTLEAEKTLFITLGVLSMVHNSLRKQHRGHLLNSIKKGNVDLDLGEGLSHLIHTRLGFLFL